MSASGPAAYIMGKMQAEDMNLLREFAATGAEAAFTALVHRHVNLVYAAALRRLGNPAEAEEVAQAVFLILAQKAAHLRPDTVLSGWLYRTAQLTAANHQRVARRRQRREQEAFMQFTESSPPDFSSHRLGPLLEEAMARLNARDRDALVLRFFENRTVSEVAAALGLGEAAAQKRVNRATARLRHYFTCRGIQVSAPALVVAMGATAAHAAPAGLAQTISTVAVAQGVTASASTLTLMKGALKVMAWTKMKTALTAGAIVLAVGTATITITEIHGRQPYPWQVENANTAMLNRVPPQVKIVPTIFPPRDGGFNMSNNKLIGMGQTINSLLGAAYQISRYRIIFTTSPPAGNYDFIANLPEANHAVLQREIERQFNLTAKKQTREMNVLVLTRKYQSAPGLKPNPSKSSNVNNDYGAGWWRGSNLTSQNIAGRLEKYLKIPVVDNTGLAGRFNVELKWDEPVEGQRSEALKQVLLNQLGLELVATNMPIEMLVVDKAK